MQKTLESVFLSPYESLKINHDTNYLITYEDTVEDPLKSVQFYIKSKSFFISCYSPSTVFILLQKTLKPVFLPRHKSLILNHDTNYLMTSEDTVEDPLMSVQFYITSKSFFIPCCRPSTVFILLQKTLDSAFLPRYESLKLNNDTNYLIKSEDKVEHPLMSVQFFLNSKFFHFVLQFNYCFHFNCKRRLNCISTTL